jgi:hypothetical protein
MCCLRFLGKRKSPERDAVCVISVFRRDVYEICALLGYYAAFSGSSVPTFRDISDPSSRFKKSKKKALDFLKIGTDSFSRNVGIELPLIAA